jgi:hypothetical protein
MVGVFSVVRDHDLAAFRRKIEEIPRELLDIDAECGKPVRLQWESQLVPGISWSSAYGIMGPGLILHVNKKAIAMVQIGAVDVAIDTYDMIPSSWYIDKFVPSTERKGFVLTQRNFFMSYEGLKDLGDPDFVRTVQPDTRFWYQVTSSCFEFAIQRLVARYKKD